MFRVMTLLALLFAPESGLEASSRCPADAELEGFAPPDGDGWACVLPGSGSQATRHGWSADYWPNGTMKLALEYDHGEPHGRFSRWSEDGQLVARGRYEHGQQVGYWWYWGVVEKGAYDPDGAVARAFVETLLEKVGVAEADAPALGEYLLEKHREPHADIRVAPQVCAPSACLSSATVKERTVLAIQLIPPANKVSATGPELARLAQESKVAREAITQKRKRRDRKQERALEDYDKKMHSWDYTRVRCSDGTRSPSCICGGDWRGCCSHHGGVSGCPRDLPEAPTPDTSPLVPNELLESGDG